MWGLTYLRTRDGRWPSREEVHGGHAPAEVAPKTGGEHPTDRRPGSVTSWPRGMAGTHRSLSDGRDTCSRISHELGRLRNWHICSLLSLAALVLLPLPLPLPPFASALNRPAGIVFVDAAFEVEKNWHAKGIHQREGRQLELPRRPVFLHWQGSPRWAQVPWSRQDRCRPSLVT